MYVSLFSIYFHATISVCCGVICSSPLEAAGDRRVRTLQNLHSPPPLFRHDPSSSNNVTCIRRQRHYPIYIILDLVGIPTNDLMSIVINIITENLHGKIEKGYSN